MALQDQILGWLPTGVRAFVDGSSRRDLLRKVDTTLIVFDNAVGHLESGNSIAFQDGGGTIDAARLARASQTLLGDAAQNSSILLLLPPGLYIATNQPLPGVSRESLHSALLLQTDSLLPANDSPLSLAINPKALDFTAAPIALWQRSESLTELFGAFAEEGMFVAAIKPRPLGLPPLPAEQAPAASSRYLDADATTLTFVETREDVVLRWLQTERSDLENPEFAAQWQDAITGELGEAGPEASGLTMDSLELNSLGQYLELARPGHYQDYSFYPQGALSVRKQLEKGRKLALAASLCAGLLLLAAIPFIVQSWQFRSLAATLEEQRELSLGARQDQAVVVNFENELGPLYNFPEQRIREAMFTLQAVLSPSQLSSLEVSKGVVKLQGTSSEPQAILQRLEGDPMFTEVAFSRATNNDRYYIDLRLAAVNFDAYMVRYFPD